jgi:3-hydroxyacyl-[acyl-carrier-protein] dehydratase
MATEGQPAWYGRLPLQADAIARVLPHRAPFLFLDRVLELDPPDRAVGLKNVTIAEPWCTGHFPGQAILPGVLVAECLAQLAGVLIAAGEGPGDGAEPAGGGPAGVLAEVKRFRFRQRIVPGDQVRLEVGLSRRFGRVREFACAASVGSARVAHGTLVISA